MKKRTSYDAYLNNRNKLKAKGYALDPVMSRKEFNKNFQRAKDLGMKNIARTFAHEDLAISRSMAKAVIDFIKSQKAFAPDLYKDVKKMLGGKITQSAVMGQDINFTKVFNPQDPSKQAKSSRQAVFYKMWETLGNKNDAEINFGY